MHAQVYCRATPCPSSLRCPLSRLSYVSLPLAFDRPARAYAALAQVSNTISQAEHVKQADGKLEVMDISPVLAESIRRVRFPVFATPQLADSDLFFSQTHNGESISLLFK